jgi:hypothetical protein
MRSLPLSTGMTTDGILQNAGGWRAGCVDIPAFEGGAWGGRSDEIAHCAQPSQRATWPAPDIEVLEMTGAGHVRSVRPWPVVRLCDYTICLSGYGAGYQ